MFEFIERWVFAMNVCKKYGLRFKPIWYGEFDGYCDYKKSTIATTLFRDNFYEMFFHEIGHHMDRRWYFSKQRSSKAFEYLKPFRNMYYSTILVSEARASRYAVRLLKASKLYKEDSIPVLTSMLATYVSWVLRSLVSGSDETFHKLKIADVDYKLCKYISGRK